MKCIILADVHLDMYLNRNLDPFEGITHCIIAGDLSNKAHKQWKRCLPWLAEQFPDAKLYVLPGNHDYYDGLIDDEERLAEVAEVSNAEFVQKSEVIFGQHRFLFATLWTDFEVYGDRADNMRTAARVMSDYHYIRVARNNYRRLTPVKTAEIHLAHRAWLTARLYTGLPMTVTEKPSKELAVTWIAAPLLSSLLCHRAKRLSSAPIYPHLCRS